MLSLRLATPADLPAIDELIGRSVRALSVGFYSPAQVESALRHVFGPDTQLIADRTYHVIDAPGGGSLAAAGGWSRRRTLYGGDQMKAPTDALLDPRRDPARIRAFYVHPDWARQGLARRLFAACRLAAEDAGFTELELMATLPGQPLYTALGFVAREQLSTTLPDGVVLPFVRMSRPVARQAGEG